MTPPRKGLEKSAQAPADGEASEDGQLSELSFEASLERLEGVVDRLEQGDLELEASLKVFEEGVRLSARCSLQLASAQQRIEILTQESGNWVSRPFESGTNGTNGASGVEAGEAVEVGEVDDLTDGNGEESS